MILFQTTSYNANIQRFFVILRQNQSNMKKIFLFIMTVTVTALLATSCGGKGSKETAAAPATVEEQNTQLAEALSAGNVKAASAMADSMSLFVDDFTPNRPCRCS